MSNALVRTWKSTSTTWKTIIVLTILFFIGRTLGKH